MHKTQSRRAGAANVITLVVVAVVLAIVYLLLDRYSEGQKYVAMTEARGTQIIQGLAKHKLEAGAYPAALAALAPKFMPALPNCPNGEPFAYALNGGEYTLTCQGVVFKSGPYGYDSRAKAWHS